MVAKLTPIPLELLKALAAKVPTLEPIKANSSPNGEQANSSASSDGIRLRVQDWLNDMGVEHRKKDQVDGLGRTVYPLKHCPFNPDHGDPDSCIMQAPDGQLSAKCLHNSCEGKGWKDFKAAIGAPKQRHYDIPKHLKKKRVQQRPQQRVETDGDGPPSGSRFVIQESGLPRIITNWRQLRNVTDETLQAILVKNDPPQIFQRAELLTRIRQNAETGACSLEPMDDDAVRGYAARVADWYEHKETQTAVYDEPVPPPSTVIKDIQSLPSWPGIPSIKLITECPVLDQDGNLVATPGYHPQSKLWYQPVGRLDIPTISDRPAQSEIDEARALLLVELFGDFPFADDKGASRAHALAALLLPFVRLMIDGPTPLHLFDAPTEGTGKTLLAHCVCLPASGRESEAMAEGGSDEEWRKRITSTMKEGSTFVMVDNVSRTLDSAALASVLTARVWKDRILGFSKTGLFPNTSVWMASGNNTILSRELIRRTLWCRLDSKRDNPWERKPEEFRHPEIIKWAKQNRGKLIWAALTLCRAWIAAGKPAGKQTLGMYESWAGTIGGILGVAGVPGLLDNAAEFRKQRADRQSEWKEFVQAWFSRHGKNKVGAGALFDLSNELKLLCSVLGDGTERSQRSKLGRALAKAADRVYGNYRILKDGEDHSGLQQYRLDELAPASPRAAVVQQPATEAAGVELEEGVWKR